MDLARLLDQQGAELSRLSDDAARTVLLALEDARRAILERLSATRAPSEASRLRVLLAQASAGVEELRVRLGVAMSAVERRAHRSAIDHLMNLVEAAGGAPAHEIPIGIVERLARREGLLLHQYSVDRYSAQVIEAIQREIVRGTIANLSTDEIARRIAGAAGSVVSGHRGRAELIARMEVGRAYNDSYLDSLYELDEMDPQPDDPLLKRIEEYIDARNHPFSRVADQMVAPIMDAFRVPVAAVSAAAKAMRRPPGGVVWPVVGNAYEGHNLPAHYNDRGRIVAWRKSWGT